ncbi:hypothetical protein J2Y41_000582 [Arthrobacter sp. 1088]|uniref:DUF1877 family protein n=2 Tax=Arthrobacter TaxID=1663 RepID=UPI001CC4AAD4|nr:MULTISPECIES: DUF1877 family protein [unclassified Arthrobacter]MDR6685035.1 hypothetical protein [Arthrobacter sp. 1088]BCW49207.1 hypothetical protein StoSoilB13_15490 [Arthrobacter sp. StoSoilB13]
MGIRYYAYAFDGDVTDQVLSDPLSVVPADPLADAWGLEPGAGTSHTTFEQVISERDMLYLDKAWRHLQVLTAPLSAGAAARTAFRMFEGSVTMHDEGWEPWVRALSPSEVLAIAQDLDEVSDGEVRLRLPVSSHLDGDLEVDYAVGYLRRARTFARNLANEGRGMVYLIG